MPKGAPTGRAMRVHGIYAGSVAKPCPGKLAVTLGAAVVPSRRAREGVEKPAHGRANATLKHFPVGHAESACKNKVRRPRASAASAADPKSKRACSCVRHACAKPVLRLAWRQSVAQPASIPAASNECGAARLCRTNTSFGFETERSSAGQHSSSKQRVWMCATRLRRTSTSFGFETERCSAGQRFSSKQRVWMCAARVCQTNTSSGFETERRSAGQHFSSKQQVWMCLACAKS